jgi:hypothetical protein
VAARQGWWDHEDWLALLAALRQSEFWPLDTDAVGEVLAEIQAEWQNLRRWQESVAVRQWLDDQEGRWGSHDWLSLLASIRSSDFWPLDPQAAEDVLRRLTAEWWNLRTWRDSGQPHLWVKARGGQWGHEDWLALLEYLRPSQYWPLAPDAVGQVLEDVKAEWLNSPEWSGLLPVSSEGLGEAQPPTRRAA